MSLGPNSEDNSFDDVLARYRAALRLLEQWGVSVPVTCRLRSYERRLENATSNTSGFAPAHFAIQLMFDLREVDEIIAIMESFQERPPAEALRRLYRLAGGTEHPDDEAQARTRDTQYELYLYAVLTKGGIRAALGEPDLMITEGEVTFPLEAKRPRKADRVDDRLRAAVRQVRDSANGGLVALSLDHVIRPQNKYLVVREKETAALVVQGLVQEYLARDLLAIARRLRGRNVIALLFTARLPAREERSGYLTLATNLHLEPLVPADDPRLSVIERIAKVISEHV